MPKPLLPIKREGLRLHDQGFWIVPVNGKGPFWKNWHKQRRSRDELAEALANTKMNIALVVNQSKWIDAECDTPEAEAKLQELFGGKIPATPTWQSNRGKHRLFQRPKGLPARATIDLEGVEFHVGNCKGAASVIPPSVHPKTGKRYRWVAKHTLDDVKPAKLPPAIVEKLKAPAPRVAAESNGSDSIPEGKRNEGLFAKGCALKEMGLPEETILATLLDLNARLCVPPLPESEVRSISHSAASGEVKAKIGFIQRLLGDIELWHDENGDPFATVPQGDHRENWMIGKRSRPFRRWLSKLFYDTTGKMMSANDLSDIAALLEGKAVFDGPQHRTFRRIAEDGDKYFLDLCDGEWRAIEIDENGWRVVSNPPVKFLRAKAMLPLPMPIKTSGRDLHDLLVGPFLNLHERHWPLLAVSLSAMFRPMGPYPVTKLLGEQGTAKSTLARILRSVVDPNVAAVRAEPRDNRDLMIAANNGWIICLDNVSNVKPDLSDALCRLSTGGGFATRTLYTDSEETIFDAQRPVILTSIEDIGTRSDLLERSLLFDLPEIPDDKRRTEKMLKRDFAKVHPRILGGLLDVVCSAMRRLPAIEARTETELPRLADFYMWGQAAEESLGLAEGTFAEAFTANREAANYVALESSPVVAALLKFMAKHVTVEATASVLLEKLGCIDAELKRAPGWPKLPRVLSGVLKRVAPNLRQIGITAVQDTRGGGNDKHKIWRIERQGAVQVPPATDITVGRLKTAHKRRKGRSKKS